MAKKESVKFDKEYCNCTKCGTLKKISSSNFYKSFSIVYSGTFENRMTICKECVLELSSKFSDLYGTEMRALYETCRTLDIYYEKNLFESAVDQATKQNSNTYGIYFQKCFSLPQYRDKTFKDSDKLNGNVDSNSEDFEVDEDTRDVVEFWGEGYKEKDYKFLEVEYKRLLNRYECDSYAQEILFKQIALQNLDIKNKRQGTGSVDKELKTLQDLLGSANIKPVQESNAVASEQVTFGTLIKKYENEKPIPEPIEEWRKSDYIREYVMTWFLGHFSKMMGSKNQYSDMYEKAMNDLTVNMETQEDE